MAGYVPGLGAMSWASECAARKRLAELEARLAAIDDKRPGVSDTAVEKVRSGAALTRSEAASYVGVSTKKLQRMETAGTLARCPGLGSVVRYSARDVLRLASAS